MYGETQSQGFGLLRASIYGAPGGRQYQSRAVRGMLLDARSFIASTRHPLPNSISYAKYLPTINQFPHWYRPILQATTFLQVRSYNTRPATLLVLLSFVCVFFSVFPPLISPSNAPIPGAAGFGMGAPPGGGGGGGAAGAPILGMGGGGGAPILGIGGGERAPDSGIGGGGGGGAVGPSKVSSENVPGIGAAEGAVAGRGGGDVAAEAWVGVSALSMAESGLGGAMVPKSREANCFAEPPVGPSSLSLSSLSEPASDQSLDSSCLRRETAPVMDGVSGFAASCCASFAKGLVECSSFCAGGENG